MHSSFSPHTRHKFSVAAKFPTERPVSLQICGDIDLRKTVAFAEYTSFKRAMHAYMFKACSSVGNEK